MNTLTFTLFSYPCLSLFWYCTNLTIATSFHSSAKSRSRERSCSLLLPRNWSDLNVGKPISVGITASDPYVIENCVSLVDLLGVVQYIYKTWGNSSTHLPLASSGLFFKLSIITLFVISAWPFLCGCDGVEYMFFIPKSQQYL